MTARNVTAKGMELLAENICKNKKEQSIRHYIHCDCGCGILCIEEWKDEYGYVNFAIFRNNSRLSLGQKISHVWQVLMGRPYCDDMVLSRKDIESFAGVLDGILKGDL